MKKCLYGRQECQFLMVGKCPRMKTCPLARELMMKAAKARGRSKVKAS